MKPNKDERIIAALLACSTIRSASAKCGVSESQIYCRLRDPPFREKYDAARRELLEANTRALQSLIREAVEVMGGICTDEENPPQVRLNAADAIIKNALKLTEVVDIAEQLAALEKWKEEQEREQY